MIEITDLHIPQLDMYIDKKEAQLLHYYEPEQGVFIAESPNVILRALEAGYEPLSILMEKRQVETKAKEVLERGGYPGICGRSFRADANYRIPVGERHALCHAKKRNAGRGIHL